MTSKESTFAAGAAPHFLGLVLPPITVKEFIERITGWARRKERRFVTYVNAACVNEYFRDAEYADLLRHADLLYADGQAVIWAARCIGPALPERINAGDFFETLCHSCANLDLSLYLLGSRAGIAERAADRLREKIPDLRIAGVHHGHFTPEEEPRIVEAINAAQPDLLIVGMGVPRQEKWWARAGPQVEVPVCWCVGALFEYMAGSRARAPVWMRRAGLEWLFRLVLEPRRLGRRYLMGNVAFLYRAWKNRIPEGKRN